VVQFTILKGRYTAMPLHGNGLTVVEQTYRIINRTEALRRLILLRKLAFEHEVQDAQRMAQAVADLDPFGTKQEQFRNILEVI
jgi:hypothetical protein